MAKGGTSNMDDLIEDERKSEESDKALYKEWEFTRDEAAKLFHFFQDTNLREIAEKYSCQVTRNPSSGLAKTLKISCKSKHTKKVETHILKMKQELNNLDSKQFAFNRDKSPKLSDYLNSPERVKDSVCYIPDIADSSVEITGRSYDDIWKAEHKLKVYLGEIKRTGTSRLGRQISDPGDNSDLSSSKDKSKTYTEDTGPSSLGGMYPANKKMMSIKSDKFASSFSGSASSRQGLPSSNDFFFTTRLKNEFVLKVYKASITELEVDVIVNAANNNMAHGGGIARVISRAAGWKLDEESMEQVKQHGNVEVTENIVTTAGNLTQYRAVIHAVGPLWRDYRTKTECLDALGDCVYNVLETCSKHKFRTVAMPAISAGIYAVPKELCADMYVEAAARFSNHLQQGDCPLELHIVDLDTSILKFVEVSARKWLKDPQSLNARVTLPKFLDENPHLAQRSSSNEAESVRPHRGHRGQGHGGGGQQSQSEQIQSGHVPDGADSTVQNVGGSYGGIEIAEPKQKVYQEELKKSGTSRIERQISNPGRSSDLPPDRNLPKLNRIMEKQSSFSEMNPHNGQYPANKKFINTKTEKFASSFSGSASSRNGFPSSNDFYFTTTLKNEFVLKVYKASITELEVDVIVNAANNNMAHGGGVARVISRAAGWKLDEESMEYVKQHGNVEVTENIVTTAGNLTQYRAVIHAVGPLWRDYRTKTECLDALGDCVYNVLETCSKHKFRTVAMPAISAGIYAVPKELCADMYVEAAARFSNHLQQGDCPIELHIVDVDTSILKFVEVSARKWKKDPQSLNARVTLPKFLDENPHLAQRSSSNEAESVRPHRGHRGQGHGGGGQQSQSDQVQSGGRGKGGSQMHTGQASENPNKYHLKNILKRNREEKFRWGGKAQVYEIGQKVTVKIFKGEVSKAQNVDAIVSCIEKSFMATGFVALALETAGGKEYKKMFEKMRIKYRTFADIGSVFKCKAGSLGVHHVMHVVMDKISKATPEETECYSDHIYRILKKADVWKYEKLVMPLFGTGLIQNQPDKIKACCVAVLKGIDGYLSESRSKGKVTEIHLVNKDDIVCETLMKVFDEAVNTASGDGSSTYRDSGRGNVSGVQYDRSGGKENLENSVGGRRSAKDSEGGKSVPDHRHDRHGKRKQFENSDSSKRSSENNPNEFGSRGRHQSGAASNAGHSEVAESDSACDSDSHTGDFQAVPSKIAPTIPPKQEPKRTGNLMIIEN